VLKIPAVDDWYRLSLIYQQFHRVLKDYGYMAIMDYLDSDDANTILVAGFTQLRVEAIKFDAGVFDCELPICLGVMFISSALPSDDFFDELFLVRDAAVETL
jgi:hypothetical protein